MNFKNIIIEYIQATAFATVVTFLLAIIGMERTNDIGEAIIIAFIAGGIPFMLSKRFIISFIRAAKETNTSV